MGGGRRLRRRGRALALRNLGQVVLAPEDQLLLAHVGGRADADAVLLVRRRRCRSGHRCRCGRGPARLRAAAASGASRPAAGRRALALRACSGRSPSARAAGGRMNRIIMIIRCRVGGDEEALALVEPPAHYAPATPAREAQSLSRREAAHQLIPTRSWSWKVWTATRCRAATQKSVSGASGPGSRGPGPGLAGRPHPTRRVPSARRPSHEALDLPPERLLVGGRRVARRRSRGAPRPVGSSR